MVAVNVITAAAHKETAKQAIIKRLRDAEANNAAMPASVEIDSDDAKTALGDLIASGKVREARTGLYYLGDSASKAASPGLPFVIILSILILGSFAASMIAIAGTGG
jgi:hypothetical protein